MKKLTLTVLLVVGSLNLYAQTVAFINYRKVPQKELETFMNNEAMYWSKIHAVMKEKGHIVGWSINVRAGGGLDSEPNVYSRIALKSMEDWDDFGTHWSKAVVEVESQMDPDKLALIKEKLKQDKFSVANVLHQGVDGVWAKDSKWNFLVHNYVKTVNPAQYLEQESKIMKPFFEKTMKEGKTKQKGWVTSLVLSPRGYSYNYNVMTVDFYENFSDIFNALDSDVSWPENITALNEMKQNQGFWKSSIWQRAMYLDSENNLVIQ